MTAQSELARPINVETLDEQGRAVAIEADAGERVALARRFGLIAIERLAARAQLSRRDATILAEGRLEASVVQRCVATGESLPAMIDTPFAIRFVPEAEEAVADERELDADDLDTVGYRGVTIDIGEAVAETLALALDPFPRSPDADAILKQAGVLSEGEAGPFAALKDLLKK